MAINLRRPGRLYPSQAAAQATRPQARPQPAPRAAAQPRQQAGPFTAAETQAISEEIMRPALVAGLAKRTGLSRARLESMTTDELWHMSKTLDASVQAAAARPPKISRDPPRPPRLFPASGSRR